MKALTIWQPHATLIMALAKPFEFRFWDYRTRYPQIEGQRIVIHASARKFKATFIKEMLEDIDGWCLKPELARPVLERAFATPLAIPLAAGLGTAVIGKPRMFGNIVDERGRRLWGWPLTDIKPFEPIQPCKGWQGFWNYPKDLAA